MTASFDLIIILVAKYAIVIPVLLVTAEIVRRRVFARDLSEAALGGTLTIGLVKLGGGCIPISVLSHFFTYGRLSPTSPTTRSRQIISLHAVLQRFFFGRVIESGPPPR